MKLLISSIQMQHDQTDKENKFHAQKQVVLGHTIYFLNWEIKPLINLK